MESLVKGLSKPFEVAEHNTTCSLNFLATLKLMIFYCYHNVRIRGNSFLLVDS